MTHVSTDIRELPRHTEKTATFFSNPPRLIIACCLAALIAGCGTPQDSPDAAGTLTTTTTTTTNPTNSNTLTDLDRQTAFRLRSDFAVGLNVDAGWAAGLNENATLSTDEPFRLRFEVEAAGNSSAASAEKQYQLQYQHNNGPWQLMPAENFPQPEKVLELDFNASQGSDLNNAWQFLTGNASSATITDDGNDTFLHLGSGAEATIALGRYETLWDPAQYTVDIRLPAGEQSGAGLIFGYVDEQNYNRVELNTDGIVSVERVVSGAAIRIAQGVTNIDFDRWNEVKIVLEENQAIVDYNDGALELTAAFDAAIPASVLGLFVPAQSTAEFDNLVIEGAPRSPRISIMASNTFQHGAPTVN